MRTYRYKPLTPADFSNDRGNSIRLLKLLPGLPHEPVECQLSVHSVIEVANNKIYEALSYCWGTEEADRCIILGDTSCEEEEEMMFNVRQALYEALCALRFEDQPRTLWIDAICINQTDNIEKSVQVGLMRQIYEGARSTLIWLGPSTPDTSEAMAFVRTLKLTWDKCNGDVAVIAQLTDEDLKQLGLPDARDWRKVPEQLLRMLELPWFERAWVVQEVTVSTSAQVYWGAEQLDWRDFVTAICFASRAELPHACYGAYQRVVTFADEDFLYRHNRSHLLSALLRHRSCKVTEPLDKVYAFLGLTSSSLHGIPLVVDYEKDLVVAYTEFARKIAHHGRSLDILSMPAKPHAGEFQPTILNLPTWAPDWGVGFQIRNEHPRYVHQSSQRIYAESMSLANIEEAGSRVSRTFSATGTSCFTPVIESVDYSLTVQGQLLDLISSKDASLPFADRSTYPALNNPPIHLDWEDAIGLDLSLSSMPVQTYITGEGLLDAFCQTILVGNIAPTENVHDLTSEYCTWSKSHRFQGRMGYYMSGLASSFFLYQNVPASFEARLRAAIFRTFVQTEKEYMGLVSGKVERGDQIWLLKGSKVPVVLRKKDEKSEYEVVGDAYVHGVMYGEAFDEEQCEQIVLI
ncbi:HET-domain-containing protein [Venturia nashicola]|uniref:HET-domain-containing protein n=1 Tax=Venturia nashicola TaxID=86259 RepID=A0A4Z1NFZ6_9PEZI|nr:HET-domain-containing protein [Venturia nashicola]TLD20163.1 HET-domain-containing protein [Venturia nashicola]